jgi:tyrosinase
MKSRTTWLATFVACVVILSLTGPVAAQVPLRKNIDLLTPDELAAYEHAIQIMKDRSAANSYDRTGYLWQAWVHNCFLIFQPANGVGHHDNDCDDFRARPDPSFVAARPGMCEHGKDLFLVWHRAEFYYFEQILRATDPDGTIADSRGMVGPSTSNVAVPFWNWMRKPSGERYPKAFEDPDSPLFHSGKYEGEPVRVRGPLSEDEKRRLEDVTDAAIDGPSDRNALALAALILAPDWLEFGGYPQEAPVGGFGRFEKSYHNPMHGFYFGPASDMSNPKRAALDPAFFSFHAYIDLVFQFWLEEHAPQSMTSLTHFLRAAQSDSIAHAPGHVHGAGLPSMGPASIYIDPASLAYGYEVTDADKLPQPPVVAEARFGTSEKSPFALLSGDGAFDPAAGPPTLTAEVEVPIPTGTSNMQAAFSRPHDASDLSYLVDLYLHPSGPDFDLADETDREKYIVIAMGYWGTGEASGHGSHGPDKPLFADLTGSLADLSATGHAGETWTLTAVVSGQPPSPDFGALTLFAQ